MSIWSRNHTELAKLARTIHDRNVHTRNKLTKRLGVLNATHPLDPRKSRSESCLATVAEEEKENVPSRTHGDDLDDGPVIRLRVDSCSSVDSAISPDFHRGPLSPILKHTCMASSDPSSWKSSQCNGISIPKVSDKRVTFDLHNEDSDEYIPFENDVHSTLDGENMSNGEDISALPSFESTTCDLMTLNSRVNCTDSNVFVQNKEQPQAPEVTEMINSVNKDNENYFPMLPSHPKTNINQHQLNSDLSSKEHNALCTNSLENERQVIDEPILSLSTLDESYSNAHSDASAFSSLSSSLSHSVGVVVKQSSDNTIRKNEDDEQKVPHATWSSDLNLSSELNLLLISLLANHQRDQLPSEKKSILGDSIEGDKEILQNDNRQTHSNNYCSSDGNTMPELLNGENEIELTQSTTTHVERNTKTHENHAVVCNDAKSVNGESVNCIVVNSETSGNMINDTQRTDHVEEDILSQRSLFITINSHSAEMKNGENIRSEIYQEKLECPILAPVMSRIPNSSNVNVPFASPNKDQSSTVRCQDYHTIYSSAKYTVAGNTPSTFIYSHLHKGQCNSLQSELKPHFSTAQYLPSMETTSLSKECHQSNSLICTVPRSSNDVHCVSNEETHPIKAHTAEIANVSVFCTAPDVVAMPLDLSIKQTTNNETFNMVCENETPCQCVACVTKSSFSESQNTISKDKETPTIPNIVTHTQKLVHDVHINTNPEVDFENEVSESRAMTSTENGVIQSLADSARRKIWQHVSNPSQTSENSPETPMSSLNSNRMATIENPAVDDLLEFSNSKKSNESFEITETISNDNDLNVEQVELSRDVPNGCTLRQHGIQNSMVLPTYSEHKNSLSPVLLPPPSSAHHGNNDTALCEDITSDSTMKGKEELSPAPFSVSVSDIRVPIYLQTETRGENNPQISSQSDHFHARFFRQEAEIYSDDTTYRSSSSSLVNGTGDKHLFSSSHKVRRRYKSRSSKPQSTFDDLRNPKSMAQPFSLPSPSYESDTSSVFWSSRIENVKSNNATDYFDKRDEKKPSSHDKHSRINDNISWLLKSQNTSSSQDFRNDSFSSRKTRRKKKSRPSELSLNQSCVGHGHATNVRSHSESSQDTKSDMVRQKTPSGYQSEGISLSNAIKMENELKRVLFISKSNLSQLGQNRLDDMIKESLCRLDASVAVAENYPCENLKTVKDALAQLSVFLGKQQHCNKQNVLKEIHYRRKLFRKICSFKRIHEYLKEDVYYPLELDENFRNYVGKEVSEIKNNVEETHQDKDKSGRKSSPSSLSNATEERRRQIDSKHNTKKLTRKVDLIFMEHLLEKIINSGADALSNGDVLKGVVDEWKSVKRDKKDFDRKPESPPKRFSNSSKTLTDSNPFYQMAQFLTQELSLSSTFIPPKQHLLQTNNSTSLSNNTKISTETSSERQNLNLADDLNQCKDTEDSTIAPYAFTPIEAQRHYREDQKADATLTGGPNPSEDQEVSAIMDNDSQTSFRLDREFDKHLADMKPYVLKLPLKTDRQKCAVWIKKFCDPPGSGITARKTRNMYAQLMLQMLKKGSLASPFDQRPAEGYLQPLPSYMSIYFDDPLTSIMGQAERLPDWVEGELGDTAGSSSFAHSMGNPAATSTWVSSIGDFRERPHSSMGHTMDKDPSLSPIRNSEFAHSKGYSRDDLSIEIKGASPSPPRQRRKSHNSPEREKRQLPDIKVREEKDDRRHQDHSQNDTDWSKPYTSSASLPKGTTFHEDISYHKPADREVAVRTKMIEAKFHEEKLKLQQKHDAAVQKILDRKNAEIEDVKNHYRSKSKEMEEAMGKLEKKVQTLMKETEFVRESKDKHISEMKKLAEDSNETRRKEFEKRLHDVMSEFEQEKFDMQKQHTQNIQEILDDTNTRLQRMESEYSQQTTTTTNVIKELESRVQQLMNEVDCSLSQRSVVEKDRNDLQAKLEKLIEDYERLKERHQQVERDHQVKTETHEHDLRSLKNKTEASLEFFKQEHTMAASKAADTTSELEQKIEQLKKSLKDSEENRHRHNREMEQVHQQDKLHIENLHDKQVRNMKKEMEQLDADWSKKLSKMEQQIKDKEAEIFKLREQKQQQAIQSEQALEEFKLQVEKNQTRMYDEMKQQMEQVESDLTKSKQSREKQSKEFTRQQEEDKYKHQHEMAELKMSFEGDKSQLMRDFHVQKEYIITEHDKEIDNLKDIHRAETQAMEARMRERQDKLDKSATDSERLIRELREELVQANQLRKQQLVELGLLREEEKQKVQRDHEAELSRFRTEREQQRLEQQRTHSAEMESVLEKTNERLKSIEQEYAERGNKSSESISELQSVVLQLRGDIKRSRESSDDKLAELKHQYEEERQNLRKQYAQNMMSMQKELESQHTKSRELERQLQRDESDHEEKMTQLKFQFEEKVRGLMPVDVKQELEDTIASLKSQVASLQQRALLLQEELESRNRSQLTPFGSTTCSPIKSTV